MIAARPSSSPCTRSGAIASVSKKIPARLVVERLRGRAFDACNQLGGGAVILSSGHRVVCGDGAVITVLVHGQRFYGFYGKHRR